MHACLLLLIGVALEVGEGVGGGAGGGGGAETVINCNTYSCDVTPEEVRQYIEHWNEHAAAHQLDWAALHTFSTHTL